MIEPAISRMIMDINSPESRCSLTVIRGDTARQLRISLTCDGKPYDIGADCYVLLTGVKPDGVEIIETCSVIENQVVYDFTEKAINVEGITECQILICENQSKQQIAAAKFSLIVLPAVIDNSSASKSEAYTSLVRLLSNTEQLIKSVEKRLKNGEFNGQGIWATTNKFQDGREHFFVRKESVVRITNSAKAVQVNDILLFPEGDIGVIKSITTGFFEISPSGISLRGTYFFTDEDREKIKADSIAFLTEELEKRGQLKPEFANSIEECTDTTKLYVLPDGDIWAYMNKTTPEVTIPNFTNQLPISTDTSEAVYNDKGFKENIKFSSSGGAETAASGVVATGYIPIEAVGSSATATGETVIYLKDVAALPTSANVRLVLYDGDKTYKAFYEAASSFVTSPTANKIVYTLGEDGYIKGSIRGLSNCELVSFKNYLASTGLFEYVQGHDNAAGCSIPAKSLSKLHEIANKELAQIDFNSDYYEVEFERQALADDLRELIFDLDSYRNIWSQQNSQPLIYIKDLHFTHDDIQIMGKNKDTLKIVKNGIAYMKFFAKDVIEELNSINGDIKIEVVGKPNVNEWGGNITPQIFIEQIEIKEDKLTDF